jgi:hypothetical protein
MIKPHGLFTVWSPDTVAECLEGIGNTDLYLKIWNEIVPLYANQPRSEVPDDFDRRCLKKYWSKFTDDEKRTLNAAAERHEANWKQP